MTPLILRMSGYPFTWLEKLVQGAAVPPAGAVLAARQGTDEAAGAVLERTAVWASSTARVVAEAVRQRRRPPARALRGAVDDAELLALATELDRCHDREDSAERAYQEAYDGAWAAEAGAVTARFRADEALGDVLLVSNDLAQPAFVRWLERAPTGGCEWRATDRKNVDTLVRYLQRICAKNDTTSHLGPFAIGRFDAGEPAALAWRPGPTRQVTLLSRWAADALARRAGDEPALWPRLRPRRAPGAFVEGGTLRTVRFDYGRRTPDLGRAVRFEPAHALEPVEVCLLGLATGERCVAELAAAAGLAVPETVARLRGLEDLGAVVCGPEIPYGVQDPLAWLRAELAEAGLTGWVAALDDLAERLRDLGCGRPPERPALLAELRERFTAAAGVPAEREQRGFYSDRMVFSEECEGRVADVRAGSPVLAVVGRELGPVCDLYLVGPRRRLQAERELLADWMARRFPGRGDVPLDRYLQAFLDDLPGLEPGYARIDCRLQEVGAALERMLVPEGAWMEPVVDVAVAALEAAVREHGLAMPATCNPDLLVAAGEGGPVAVVGEIHLGEENLSHGLFAPFVARDFPDFAAEVAARYRELLEPDEELVDVSLHHRNKTFVRMALPCPDVEACDRSSLPRSAVIPLHRLVVRATAAGPRLRAPGVERFLRPLTLPLAWMGLRRSPFHVFGFPLVGSRLALPGEGRPHAPRFVTGRIAFQREEWRVPAACLAADDRREGFLRVQAVRRERGLARHVYARSPVEPKPLYCDLDSPLLVRHLTRMATGAAEGEGTVVLSEMLPEPHRLRLRDDAGVYTSELRCALFDARR